MVRPSLFSLSVLLLASPLSFVVQAHPAPHAELLKTEENTRLSTASTTAAPFVHENGPSKLIDKRTKEKSSDSTSASKTEATISPTTTDKNGKDSTKPTSTGATSCKLGGRGLFARGCNNKLYIPRPTYTIDYCDFEDVNCWPEEALNDDDGDAGDGKAGKEGAKDKTSKEGAKDKTGKSDSSDTDTSGADSRSGSGRKGGTESDNTSSDSEKSDQGKKKGDSDDESSSGNERRSLPDFGTTLVKRGGGGSRKIEAEVQGGKIDGFGSRPYPGPSKLFEDSKGKGLDKFAFYTKDEKDLGSIELEKDYAKAKQGPGLGAFATEHIIEIQTIVEFIQTIEGIAEANAQAAAAKGNQHQQDKLIQMVKNKNLPPKDFFMKYWKKPFKGKIADRPAKKDVTYEGNDFTGKEATLSNLVYQGLGSKFNREDFVLLEKALNTIKEDTWVGDDPMAKAKFNKYYQAAISGEITSNRFFTPIRKVLMVYQYFNNKEVKDRLQRAIKNIGHELSEKNIEFVTGAKNVDLKPYWDEFMELKLKKVKSNGVNWITKKLDEAEKDFEKLKKTFKAALDDKLEEEKDKKYDKAKVEKEIKEEDKLFDKLKEDFDDVQKAVDDKKKLMLTLTGAKLEAEKKNLEKLKEPLYEAEKKMGQQRRKINKMTSDGLKDLIKDVDEDLRLIAYFKTKTAAVKMPASK